MWYDKHAVQPASHLHWSGCFDCSTSPEHLLTFKLTRWPKIVLIKILFCVTGRSNAKIIKDVKIKMIKC